jgi:TM2 domain-containing membrane protein YozV
MSDRHERKTFADEAMGWLHWATCWIGGVVITAFIASLFFRAIVGVY